MSDNPRVEAAAAEICGANHECPSVTRGRCYDCQYRAQAALNAADALDARDAEIARYEKALKRIADYGTHEYEKVVIARKALNGGNDDTNG